MAHIRVEAPDAIDPIDHQLEHGQLRADIGRLAVLLTHEERSQKQQGQRKS